MSWNVALPGVYLFELAAARGELKSDYIVFRATVAAGGDGIVQPDAIQLRSGYDYFITGIRAAASAAAGGETATEDASADDVQALRFNLRASDRDENLFTNDIELALLVDGHGGKPVAPITWYGHGYRVRAGSHLKCLITARETVTAARAIAIGVECALIPENFHQTVPRF